VIPGPGENQRHDITCYPHGPPRYGFVARTAWVKVLPLPAIRMCVVQVDSVCVGRAVLILGVVRCLFVLYMFVIFTYIVLLPQFVQRAKGSCCGSCALLELMHDEQHSDSAQYHSYNPGVIQGCRHSKGSKQ
jgi:hypothetical protein